MESPISPNRAERIRRLFVELMELPGASRAERLEQVRADDPDLGRELESLCIVADEQTGAGPVNVERLLSSEPAADAGEDLAGRTVSHFRIIERLGSGGMGVVYRAEDVRLNRTVALKFLPPHLRLNEAARARIVREARTASRLDHPNVCTVYEADQTSDGRTFIAMPCYEGHTLEHLLSRGSVSVEDTLDYARQVLDGLEAAHEGGVIHRDVKPANLFVTTDGTVKILDFGLATLATPEITKIGGVVGTAAYMSPEQVRGEEVDRRTDLWSFGAVLYEMVSGEKAFPAAYELAVLYAVLHVDPEPLPDRIPDQVRHVIERCLEKNRENRHNSAAEVKAALGRHAGPASVSPGVKRRHKTWIAATAAVLIVALGIGVAMAPADTSFKERIQSIVGVSATDAPVRHVAVLPFTSYGGDERKDAFAEGFFEILTSRLAQMNNARDSIWVVPTIDVRREEVRSVDAAHDVFGVRFAVTGSLHWTGEAVRLTLNLVDAVTLRQLDSRIVDGDLADVAGLEETVADLLAGMIGLGAPEAGPLHRVGELVGVESDRPVFGGSPSSVPGAYEFFVTGKGYLQQYDQPENIDAAVELLREATRAHPDFALAHAALAEAYWRKYEYTRDQRFVEPASAHADTASSVGADLAPVLVAVGMVQRGVGRYEASSESLQRALELDDRSADAHRELARTYERLASESAREANLRRAEEHFQRAVDLRTEYWAVHRELGVFYYGQQRFGEAVAEFEHAARLVPRNARIFGELAGANVVIGRFSEAAKAFERALELNTDYRTYVNLGTAYILAGDYAKAVEALEKAIAENDTNYMTWATLGEAYYWSAASRELADEAFRRAIELGEGERSVDARNALPAARLATFHAYRGEMDRARQLVDEVLDTDPRDSEVFARLGEVYALAENHQQAEAYVERALEQGFPVYYISGSPLLSRYIAGDALELPDGV